MKNGNLTSSFKNAINGLFYVIKSERNMKIHVIAAFLAISAGVILDLSPEEFLLVCFAVCMVIVSEIFNTAIELIVDVIVDIYHPKAKIIKDIAAGGVLVSAIFAVVVGYVVFYDKLTALF